MTVDFSISSDALNKSNTPYVMAANSLEGFKRATSMGQHRLAFDYLNLVIDKLIAEIDSLKAAQAPAEPAKAVKAKTTEA